MKNQLSWMRGTFDPVETEINFLKSKLLEARRAGDHVRASLILSNLHIFEQLRATG